MLKCFYANLKPQRSLDTRPSASGVYQLIFAAHTGRVCNPVVFASSLPSDYIQCPHCQRRFNQSAAERHINFCKEQAARIPNKGKLEAKKTPIRTQVSPFTRLRPPRPPVCVRQIAFGFGRGQRFDRTTFLLTI